MQSIINFMLPLLAVHFINAPQVTSQGGENQGKRKTEILALTKNLPNDPDN
jgi:hypothetical protein